MALCGTETGGHEYAAKLPSKESIVQASSAHTPEPCRSSLHPSLMTNHISLQRGPNTSLLRALWLMVKSLCNTGTHVMSIPLVTLLPQCLFQACATRRWRQREGSSRQPGGAEVRRRCSLAAGAAFIISRKSQFHFHFPTSRLRGATSGSA